MEQNNKTGIGSIISIIIIIALIVLGGLYFWGKRVEEMKVKDALIEDVATGTSEESGLSETEAITQVSDSDELLSIEAELEATNLQGLDSELE